MNDDAFFVSSQDLDDNPSEEEEAIADWRECYSASKGRERYRVPSHTEPPQALTFQDLTVACKTIQESIARIDAAHRAELQKLHNAVQGINRQMQAISGHFTHVDLAARLRQIIQQQQRDVVCRN